MRTKIVAEAELRVIQRALYGLDIAPAAWSSYRDSELRLLRWTCGRHTCYFEQSVAEPALWLLKFEGNDRVQGLMSTYVDDFLLSTTQALLNAAVEALAAQWELSKPSFASTGCHFLGIDITMLPSGSYLLTQGNYARELLGRRSNVGGTANTPYVLESEPDEDPVQENVDMALLREAQSLLGELTWMAGWPLRRVQI